MDIGFVKLLWGSFCGNRVFKFQVLLMPLLQVVLIFTDNPLQCMAIPFT